MLPAAVRCPGRYEWFYFHHDAIYDPRWAFHISVRCPLVPLPRRAANARTLANCFHRCSTAQPAQTVSATIGGSP